MFNNANNCPSCDKAIAKKLKLSLLKKLTIRCPYCTKNLRIKESRAFIVTLPFFALFGLALSEFTDLTTDGVFMAIVIFVCASYYPSRSIEILCTKLKIEEG